MKHSVGLFSVLVFILVIAGFVYAKTLAQDPAPSPSATANTQQSEAYIAAVSPDGWMVASISTFNRFHIWNAISGDLIFDIQGLPVNAFSIAWSPDSSKIATVGGDDIIRIWCVDWRKIPQCEPGRLVKEINGNSGPLLSVAWNTDGILATSGQGSRGGIRTWDTNNDYQPIARVRGDANQIAWSPDGKRLAMATPGGIYTVAADLENDPDVDSFLDHQIGENFPSWSVVWKPDGTQIAVGRNDGSITIFDYLTKREITRLQGHTGIVYALAWNRAGRLASAGEDGTIRIWNTLDNTVQIIAVKKSAAVTLQISWSADGSTLYYPQNNSDKPAGLPSFETDIEEQSLRSVFNSPTCQRACWLGIEPGVTMQNVVGIILTDLGIAYEAKDELGFQAPTQDNPFGWLPDDDLAFIDNANGQSEVRVYFVQGLVHSIKVPVHITLDLILEAYGAPMQVQHLGENAFELVYPSLGMNFYFNSRASTEFAVMLTIFSEVGALQYVLSFDSPYLLQDCTLFSTPCTIATATPTPVITPSATIQSEAHTNSILLLKESSIVLWNLDTLEQTPYIDLSTDVLPPDGLNPKDKLMIMSVKIGNDAQALYYSEGFGQNGLTPPQHTKIVRLDLSTLEKTIIFQKEGLSDFALSPNNRRAIVTYYEGEYGKSRQYSCILDLTSGNCARIDVLVENNRWAWVDDNSYLILSPYGRKLYLINANTLETQLIPIPESWYLYSFTLIPGTRNLLINATQRTNTNYDASQFLSFDLDTAELTDFAYDAISNNYPSVSDWQFSPNSKYLLYGSTRQRALVDFHTGELIAEFMDATHAEWLPESSDLLIYRWQEQGKILELLRFNIESGQPEILIEGQNLGYIIVPHTPIPKIHN